MCCGLRADVPELRPPPASVGIAGDVGHWVSVCAAGMRTNVALDFGRKEGKLPAGAGAEQVERLLRTAFIVGSSSSFFFSMFLSRWNVSTDKVVLTSMVRQLMPTAPTLKKKFLMHEFDLQRSIPLLWGLHSSFTGAAVGRCRPVLFGQPKSFSLKAPYSLFCFCMKTGDIHRFLRKQRHFGRHCVVMDPDPPTEASPPFRTGMRRSGVACLPLFGLLCVCTVSYGQAVS